MTAQGDTQKPVILVVEDDADIAYLLEFMLTREGFAVRHAAEGRAARELIDTLPPPALVLLDVMLPYLDGFQLLKHARAKPAWNAVPIVMLTSKNQEHDIVRALDSGADDYLLKPFQPNELVARLRRHLRHSA